MKIIYRHGDLMKAPEQFIVQGCNAQGVMGSGVAKLLRDHDENIYAEYRAKYVSQGNSLRLGQTVWVNSNPWVVIDAITQEFYGRDPDVVYVSYDGLSEAFSDINESIHAFTGSEAIVKVAMPLIGAGLANGKWSIISEIVERKSSKFQPVVYLMDGKIPDGVIAEVETVS